MPRGAQGLRDLARDLKFEASPAGLLRDVKRNITAAAQPIKQQVQRNAFNIPAHGPRHTGLRAALMRATRLQIATGARNVGVRLIVDGKRMPAGQEALPAYMEGERRWRHPVPNASKWAAQASHPFVAPAVPPHLPGVIRGVDAAVAQSAARLARGGH